jgi:hypothetical protein
MERGKKHLLKMPSICSYEGELGEFHVLLKLLLQMSGRRFISKLDVTILANPTWITIVIIEQPNLV